MEKKKEKKERRLKKRGKDQALLKTGTGKTIQNISSYFPSSIGK